MKTVCQGKMTGKEKCTEENDLKERNDEEE